MTRLLATFLFTTVLGGAALLAAFTSSASAAALPEEAQAPSAVLCPLTGCEVTAERLPDGRCRLQCVSPTGETCERIVECAGNGCRVIEGSGSECRPAPECAPAGGCSKLARAGG